MSNNPKCACGKSFCAHHSKVSMKVMLKEEYKHSYDNRVFHSFIKEDNKPAATIVINMIKRLEPKFRNSYNCILFYSNNTLIHKHK